ncbi:hypothetical protein V6N11_082363 [Hibiscus sabdariffa]|uniref:Uncharacterized protein n=1 Tax=Hibiscus sabdariffa TaxID=183260 RepID=A0ABR2PCC2_9ROSI
MGCKITADAMAKVGFSLPPGLLYYARPPEQISRLLIGDTAGLLYPEAYATRMMWRLRAPEIREFPKIDPKAIHLYKRFRRQQLEVLHRLNLLV